MNSLRLLAFDGGGALCLYLRLGGVSRVLVDCGCPSPAAPLAFLREQGELGPLRPLSRHLRPADLGAKSEFWLGVLGLVRGLALRPGGSWVFWQSLPRQGPGFSLQARVLPRQEVPGTPELDFFEPPLMVLGLSGGQIAAGGGGPARWTARSALACSLPRLPAQGGDLLVRSDLPEADWRALQADPGLRPQPERPALLSEVPAAAPPPAEPAVEAGRLLERGLLLGLLPWLILGGLCPGAGEGFLSTDSQGEVSLRTPPVGSLSLEANEQGSLQLHARPLAGNLLAWRGSFGPGLSRPVSA